MLRTSLLLHDECAEPLLRVAHKPTVGLCACVSMHGRKGLVIPFVGFRQNFFRNPAKSLFGGACDER